MTADTNKILAGVGPAALAFFATADTAGPQAVAFTAEVQTVTITGTPTGGTFTLTWRGLSSGSQAYNVPTATLQTALRTAWNMATLTVTGSAGASYVITFPAGRGNVPLATATSALTGGTTPTIGVVETTPGAGASPASAAIPAAFTDAGWCTQAGLVANVNESNTEIKGFGSTSTLRVIISESSRSFDLEFLETNMVSVPVYNRLPVGSVVPAGDGSFAVPVGGPLTQTYAGIFDVVDGYNHIRLYCPRLQVSAIKNYTVAAGQQISWPVTLTALPDLTGTSVYQYFVVDALAS
jgi:hypothetical protein